MRLNPFSRGKQQIPEYPQRPQPQQQPILGGVNQGQAPPIDVSRFVTLNDNIPRELETEMWFISLKDLSLTQIEDSAERETFIKRMEIEALIEQANEHQIYIPDVYERAQTEKNMRRYIMAARVNLSRSIAGKHVTALTSATSKIETQNTTPQLNIGENAVNAFFPKG